METPLHTILAKLACGALRRDRHEKAWGGLGNGQPCDGSIAPSWSPSLTSRRTSAASNGCDFIVVVLPFVRRRRGLPEGQCEGDVTLGKAVQSSKKDGERLVRNARALIQRSLQIIGQSGVRIQTGSSTRPPISH